MYLELLYIIGYLYYDKNKDNLLLTVHYENTIFMPRKSTKTKFKLKQILLHTYSFLIFTIMSWSIVYSLYRAIKNNDPLYFFRNIFQVLFSIQYILVKRYYSYDHFHHKLSNNQSLYKRFNYISILIIFVSLSMALSSIYFIESKYIFIYTEIYNDCKSIFVILLLVTCKFYSYMTFLTNINIFISIMLYHRHEISEYSKKIEEAVNNCLDILNFTDNIANEYGHMKYNYMKTVKKLEALFGSLHIFGFIGVYSYLKTYQNNISLDVFEYIHIGVFLLSSLIYILSVNKVKDCVEEISAIIHSPAFIRLYYRSHNDYIGMQYTDNIEPMSISSSFNANMDYNKTMYNNLINLNEMIKWNILYDLTSKQWELFKVLGIDISDSVIIQKIVFFAGMIFAAQEAFGLLSI